MNQIKSLKSPYETFAKFFEQPTRPGLRELLRGNLGESTHLDFKETWPDLSDVARHVLGMGNSGGGCIVMGVKEEDDKTLTPVGLSALEDKAVVEKGLAKFVPPDLLKGVDVIDFGFEETEYPRIKGMRFQVLFVSPEAEKLPFVSLSEGKKIKDRCIYVRRKAATEPASHDELQQVLNARIETRYSTARELDLKQHLAQLRTLYDEIPRSHVAAPGLLDNIGALARTFGMSLQNVPNPGYPKEDFQSFVGRMIEAKKKRIEQDLGV